MIFYLDTHPTKCASYYAVDHLKPATQAGIQALSDATRVLAEECRINAFERKMRDVNAAVKPEAHFLSLEQNAPCPPGNLEDPLVQWVVEHQDAWDWMLELVTDLVNEARNWFGKGPAREHIDAAAWLRVNAPRPVNAGRILPRPHFFPLPEKAPREFIPQEVLSDVLPPVAKRECIVRIYRRVYWTKYKNVVQYTKSRRPWWWDALASDAFEK